MTDPDEETTPDPTPDPADARVRALLADLGSSGSRPPGPVPEDVAARLDATLAGLAGPAGPVTPTDRSDPTHRRRWPQLLVAAAVVVVVGAGAVTATLAGRQGGQGAESSSDAGGAASSARSEGSEESGGVGDTAVPALTGAGFAGQVRTLLADPSAEARRPGRATLAAGCASPPGRGEVLTVRFEGEPAVLVVRPAREGRSTVEAWTCDASEVLARTRVAAAGDQPPD